MIWFTSDTHFGHENVLKFTGRPWETIWQMNDAIVAENTRPAAVTTRPVPAMDRMMPVFRPACISSLNRETKSKL